MAIFDFTGFTRQVPVKKSKLKKFSDLCNHIWASFQGLAENCERINIVFDRYDQTSIKGNERNCRGKQAEILTDVFYDDQVHSLEMDKFWLLWQNKVSFQQFFIKWLLTQDTSGKTICLGGCHKSDQNICILASITKAQPLLRCFHEEADDRIMYHLSHAVKTDKYRSGIILSPDTDVLVCAIYKYWQLLHFGLDKLWFISRKKNSRKFSPVHEVLDKIEPDVVPALHTLTGCDSTSKVSTKAAVSRTAKESGGELLHAFGWRELTDDMIANTEKFLNGCLSPSSECIHFEDQRCDFYHDKKFQFDFSFQGPMKAWSSKFDVLISRLTCDSMRLLSIKYHWFQKNMDMWKMK